MTSSTEAACLWVGVPRCLTDRAFVRDITRGGVRSWQRGRNRTGPGKVQRLVGVLATLCVLLCPQLSARAEGGTGRIAGVVQDQNGGVLQGAQVSVKELKTGASQSTVTGESGTYEFPALPAGVYEVSASFKGLETSIRGGIGVQVGHGDIRTQ